MKETPKRKRELYHSKYLFRQSSVSQSSFQKLLIPHLETLIDVFQLRILI